VLFNSPEFVIFVAVVYAIYCLSPFRLQNYLLLIASYIFYGWWDARFLFLVALSTTVDFWVGLMLEHGQLSRRQRLLPALFLVSSAVVFLGVDPSATWNAISAGAIPVRLFRAGPFGWELAATVAFLAVLFFIYEFLAGSESPRRRLWCLMVSLVTQLGLLGIFKYFNFFIDSMTSALTQMGIGVSSLHLDIVLPVGVSFYTFQSLSYTIDIYRREFKPTDRFWDFALFVAYFPQLQAGPIERARNVLPQLANPRRLTWEQSAHGLYLIVLGFFKKVAIADGVAPTVDQVFGSAGHLSWLDVACGTVFFAIQIYCDFSGYTDIARGVSKLLGIDLMLNFNQPYFATNPQEFWRRWHISLSSWLRDYLFKPLGGSQGSMALVCRNLMITMVLGGLWHGAAWNFVLWGFYQGALLCVHRIWRGVTGAVQHGQPQPASGTWQDVAIHQLGRIVFLIAVCYGWLIFRAHSFPQIVHLTAILITDHGYRDFGMSAPKFSAVIGMFWLLAIELVQYSRFDLRINQRWLPPLMGIQLAALITAIIIGMSNEPAQFIYFQF